MARGKRVDVDMKDLGGGCLVASAAKRRKPTYWTTDTFRAYVSELTFGEYECRGKYTKAVIPIRMKHLSCGYEWTPTPNNFRRGSRCPACAGNLPKTQETFTEEVFGLVGSEYEVLGDYVNIDAPIKMRHVLCEYEWSLKPKHFLSGTRCPSCAIIKKLKTQETFTEEVFGLVGSEYEVLGDYLGTNNLIKMKHLSCGYEWSPTPDNFLRGRRCPACAASKGETRIARYLESCGHVFIREYRFNDCRNRRPLPFDAAVITADRVIPIEYDGEHHTRPVDFAGRGAECAERQFRRVQRNDAIKTEYCRANGIPLIRIDYTQFDEIEAILDRELSALGVTGKRNNTDNNEITQKEDAA